MTKLAKREEQIMMVYWDLGKAFIRDVIPQLPDPKPHYNSVATMVKILEEKGFLDHEAIGNMYQYFPVVSREDYQKHAMKDFVIIISATPTPACWPTLPKNRILPKKNWLKS